MADAVADAVADGVAGIGWDLVGVVVLLLLLLLVVVVGEGVFHVCFEEVDPN